MRVVRRSLLVLLGLAAGLGSAPRTARADLVVEAGSKASFWAPDGWTSSTQKRGVWALLLRRAPDDKAMCGLAVAKATGTLDWTLESVEAIWKQGPEKYERVSKADGLVAGTGGLRVEHRITADGRSLNCYTLVGASGDYRVALWVAHEAGLEAGYGPIVRRIHESLVLPPVVAPAPTPGAAPPVVPPASGTPQGAGMMFDPRFREGRAADVLVPGNAPLLRGSVDAFVDLVEAATETTLPEGEEQALRDGVESDWKKAAPEDRALFEDAVATRERAKAAAVRGDATGRRAAVAGFTDALFARAAVKPTGPWQAVVRRAAAAKLEAFGAAGEPVVPLAAVEAFEELVAFYAGVARNDGARVTEGQRLAVRSEKIRPELEGALPAARKRFAASPRLWAFVKARWDAADADTKLRLRWAAVDLVRAIAKLPEVPADVRAEGLPGYARAASAAVETLPVFDTYTNVVVNWDRVLDALLESFGVAKKDAEGVFSTDPLTLR